jgi:hypothetical protein
LIKGDGGVEEEGGLKVYPKPMFDFNERRQVCIDKVKKAYDVGMYGDDVRVNDGSWKEAFGYEDESGRATKVRRTVLLIVRGMGRREVGGRGCGWG